MKTQNQSVYLVLHSRDLKNGSEDIKIVGVFSTERRAKAAVKAVGKAPGFKEHATGFHIDRYPLDQKFWSQGFFSQATQLRSKAASKRTGRRVVKSQ